MDYWDRKLIKSQMELESIKRGIAASNGDQQKMKKSLKKTRKYFKSSLGELARLDASLYNVSKSEHTVDDQPPSEVQPLSEQPEEET